MLPPRFRRRLRLAFGVKSPRRGAKRAFGGLAILLAAVLIAFIVTLLRAGPIIYRMAEVIAADVVVATVNRAIEKKIMDGSLNYDNLVSLEKDANGNITALVTNMTKMNILQANIATAVIELLSENRASVIRVPVGNLTGIEFLSGTGPRIPVEILAVTSVFTAFSNEFSSAGINQTRHQIMLEVNVSLTILVPGRENTLNVPVTVKVAETVIVGMVPNTYADIMR